MGFWAKSLKNKILVVFGGVALLIALAVSGGYLGEAAVVDEFQRLSAQELAHERQVQIDIAKRVFSPPPAEVAWAKKVLEAMPDGSGAVMIDGKMQDDATVKQCRVMVGLADMLAENDPELKKAYEL